MKIDWTQGLNPEQSEAVLHEAGPLLILAGAGSGKTTVLVSRTGHLLQAGRANGLKASEICVLTFTTKAAKELKHRVGARVGPAARDLWSGTFHSFGLKLLRRHARAAGLPTSFGVIDQSDSEGLVKELLVNVKNGAKDGFKVERLLGMINAWRETGRKKAQTDDEYESMAEVLLPKYLRRLELMGVVDFEGLLLKPLELFQTRPDVLEEMQNAFRFVMVDEFQDTNRTQFRLIQALSQKHQNLAVVGDDDQSIYGWRGACVSNILDFPKNFENCRVVRLERNYRSTPAILDVANRVIAINADRHGKTLRSDPAAVRGEKPELFVFENDDVESEEAVRQIGYFEGLGYRRDEIAILYRSNGLGGLLEGHLRQAQIPYSITGGAGFFDRKEVRDAMAYLRCALMPNEIAFRRILNAPSRGIGDVSVDKIHHYALDKQMKFHLATRAWREAGVQQKIGENLEDLLALLDALPADLLDNDQSKTPGAIFLKKLIEIGYRDYLRTVTKDEMGVGKRWVILEILSRVLDGFIERGGRNRESLEDFVDRMELRDSSAAQEEKNLEPRVQLLTLHACKGLEFPCVIMIGLEEDILPHKTLGSDVSEERRLFYVGVTRARERLVMTRARSRKRYGQFRPVAASRFLAEVPPDLIVPYECGFRPVAEEKRKDLMANLFAKLETSAASRRLTK